MIWSFSFAQKQTNYTTETGLPSNHIYKVLQDAKGFIWIATDKGLAKYNGTKIKTFTTKNGLATNDVWGLNVTPDGKVWFQSKAIKVGYIENDSVFTFESEKKGEILSSRYTNQIGNEIVLSNSNRFHKLIQKKWRPFGKKSRRVKLFKNFIQHNKINHLQINVDQDSLVLIDHNNYKIKQFNIKDILINNYKRGQLTDSLYYWVSKDSYKILNLNTLQLTERTLKEEINIKTSKHTRINLVNNQLQISGKGFVGILDKEFHIKETFYFPKNIASHFGFIDINKNIWLTTFNNGMYKIPKTNKNVNYFYKGNDIKNIAKVNGKIIATINNKGFYNYDSIAKNFTPYIKNTNYTYGADYIKELNASFFHSVENNIKSQNNIQKKVDFYLNNNYKTRLAVSKLIYFRKYLYAINNFGIIKIDPKTNIILKEYLKEGINDIVVFKDKLLIASTNGVFALQNDRILNFNFSDGTFKKPILNIHQINNDNLVINTDGFGSYTTNLKTIKHIPETKFLIVNDACIKQNILWLATNKGILKIDLYKTKNRSYNYTRKDGLPTNQVNTLYVNDKNIIAGTTNGIAILPNQNNKATTLLDIYFESATFNDKPISNLQSEFAYKANNKLQIIIGKIDFNTFNNTNFSYKLEPINKEWQNTTSTIFSTNNLAPNNYIFTINIEGKQKELHFTINPLIWQTSWFQFLAVFLIILIVFYATKQIGKKSQKRKNQKLLQDKKLSEIQLKALRSQMNPHFVFNSLSAIQYYINENNLEVSEMYLVKFSRLIRHFFNLSKEDKISLSEEIKLIQSYLELEQLRFKEKLNFKIYIDKNLKTNTIKIPTMLLQPVVENAVNHGVFNKIGNGNIHINFNYINAKTYKVDISDDGVGFVNTIKKNKKHNSSNIIKDRLDFLNKTGVWNITLKNKELYSHKTEKGNKSTFTITKLSE
ncbi:histidine kinase [uncultured Polaribacter sp.]|uniref:sensor histidine kinase n=1 Tax=uncultured Polaribacter sp. TaxID=174711 RepID=UPI002621665A|nr:histidine kinase [uncultured Polaribacter sp.]